MSVGGGMKMKKPVRKDRYRPAPGFAWNPLIGYPPNQQCPCGSKKKFKKCHRTIMKPVIPEEIAKQMSNYMKLIDKGEFKSLKFGGQDGQDRKGQDGSTPDPDRRQEVQGATPVTA